MAIQADITRGMLGTVMNCGHGASNGTTLNLPLPQSTADAGWPAAIETSLAAIIRFKPDALVVSLGFDASKDEALAFLIGNGGWLCTSGRHDWGDGSSNRYRAGRDCNIEEIGRLPSRFLCGFSSP